jgi:uncharacterized membrane protein (DUF4010 family)
MHEFQWTFELRFVIALALGFLVGLERETVRITQKQRVLAGVRTHTIISLYGFGCAWLSQMHVSLAIPVGMLTVAALAIVGYLAKLKEGHVGWTSEISTVLTFIVGALALLTDVWVPMALGIMNAILLSEKAELEQFVERLDKGEFLAVLKFLLVTVIILPALPNRGYTQFDLNPTRIWQIVIMVSTVGFVGYFLAKKIGPRYGLWVSGVLGGIVSSTAVCVAMGRMARTRESCAGNALQASLLASSVMYLRILVLVWILNPVLVPFIWWKLALLSAIGLLLSVRIGVTPAAPVESQDSTLRNPFEVRPALLFAVVFVAVSIITVLAQRQFGSSGLIGLAVLVGVADIDPFILSLVHNTVLSTQLMIAAVIVAMMSNTVAKGMYFGFLAKGMRRETLIRFGAFALLHVPIALL